MEESKKSVAGLTAINPTTKQIDTNSIVPQMSRLIQDSGISSDEFVRLMQNHFPKFDKVMLSKASHPESYGVVIHPQAYEILGYEKRKEKRRLNRRICVRMSEDEWNLLNLYRTMEGLTFQDFGRRLVDECIERMQKIYGTLD